jgi:microcystin degradation protein MlrC
MANAIMDIGCRLQASRQVAAHSGGTIPADAELTLRVAVGGISLESNDFVPFTAGLGEFSEAGFYAEGSEVLELAGSSTEVAGALEYLAEAEIDAVPLLAARGVSSGRLSADTYAQLRSSLLQRLRAAMPVDGVYLFFHGSMEAVGEDDPEGDLSAATRLAIGGKTPLAISCDLHGNVTDRMIENVDALVAYEHYPHDDVYSTGRRAADLLVRTVRGEVSPRMALAKLPLILTAFHSTTLEDTPFRQLLQHAKELESDPQVLSTALFLVGSYIDAPGMGCSALVITDDQPERAAAEATRLADEYWQRRHEFQVETLSVDEALQRGRRIAGGPVLLLDTADTTGGGAAGDSIALLRALLNADVNEETLVMVVDPAAAIRCHEAGRGATIDCHVGHSLDPRWGKPLHVHGRIETLTDGTFTYSAGILGGVEVSMGPAAVLAIGPIKLLIMSNATYDWGDDQYRAAGLDPAAAKFVGVKNMMNFRFGYTDMMKAYYVLDLPGPTPPDMRQLAFRRIQRPIFPLDPDLTDPQIEVVSSQPLELDAATRTR